MALCGMPHFTSVSIALLFCPIVISDSVCPSGATWMDSIILGCGQILMSISEGPPVVVR